MTEPAFAQAGAIASSESSDDRTGDRLRLATTYHHGHPDVLGKVLPYVDLLEVTPDALATARLRSNDQRDLLAELCDFGGEVGLVAHGVGLSVASWDGECEDYFRSLDLSLERLAFEWHSEHLGYTRVGGEFIGTMLPAPRTREMLDLVVARVVRIKERYGIPFLLEHVVGLLPEPPSEFSEAEFLNAIVRETGCGLVLDAYNLLCDEANQGLDVIAFLDEIDVRAVAELHIAGGVRHRGFALDVHSRTPTSPTLALARTIAERCPNLRLVTFELLDEALELLGADAIVESIQAIRETLSSPCGVPDPSRPPTRTRPEPEPVPLGLRQMQTGLRDLIKQQEVSASEPDAYLSAVESSSALEVVREIVVWWRWQSVAEHFPLTVRLLQDRGELGDVLQLLVASPELSPLHAELWSQFFSIASDADPLLSSLVRFERAMLDGRSRSPGVQAVIDWPTDPYPVLEALTSGRPLDVEPPAARHRVVVDPGEPPQFHVLAV
jgi:uncharacterized protein